MPHSGATVAENVFSAPRRPMLRSKVYRMARGLRPFLAITLLLAVRLPFCTETPARSQIQQRYCTTARRRRLTTHRADVRVSCAGGQHSPAPAVASDRQRPRQRSSFCRQPAAGNDARGDGTLGCPFAR